MMWRGDDGGWMGWWWVFMPILFITLVAVITWAVVALTRRRPGDREPRRDPQQILAERFARGEIDEAEYRRRLAILQGRTFDQDDLGHPAARPDRG
jgi:putative membrane protein